MKTAGIIAEYNPFHNGHKYLVEKVRENGATHAAAVMGGSFLQRGDCAVLDKFQRARAAVLCGVDLVIELPQVYAAASAEKFAFGAVGILEQCGCINQLAFGTECGDIELLKQTAEVINNSDEIQNLCRSFMKQGYSHPRALQAAIEILNNKQNDIADVLRSPNNTLAVEYINNLNLLNSSIEPFAVKRSRVMHDSEVTADGFASASAVRKMIIDEDSSFKSFVPHEVYEIITECIEKGKCPAVLKNNERGILTVLRNMSADDIAKLPDVTEGLENRISKAVREKISVEDILTAVKCKRYTYARLNRIIAYAYLGINKEIVRFPPKYIRVLAFNDKGTEILKVMKKTAKLPVIMSPAKDIQKLDEAGRKMLLTDIRASDLYGLLTPGIQSCGEDYYNGAVKIIK